MPVRKQIGTIYAAVRMNLKGFKESGVSAARTVNKLRTEMKKTSRQARKTSRDLSGMQRTLNSIGNPRFALGPLQAGGVIGAGLGLTYPIRESVDFAASLHDLSAATGLTEKRIQTLLAVLQSQGSASFEQVGSLVVDFNERIGQASDGIESFAEIFRKAGVNIRDEGGAIRDTSDLLTETINNLQTLPRFAASRIAGQLFGTDLSRVILSVQGDIEKLEEAFESSANITAEQAKAASEARRAFQLLSTEIKSEFAAALLEGDNLARRLEERLELIGKAARVAGQSIRFLIDNLEAFALGAITLFLPFGKIAKVFLVLAKISGRLNKALAALGKAVGVLAKYPKSATAGVTALVLAYKRLTREVEEGTFTPDFSVTATARIPNTAEDQEKAFRLSTYQKTIYEQLSELARKRIQEESKLNQVTLSGAEALRAEYAQTIRLLQGQLFILKQIAPESTKQQKALQEQIRAYRKLQTATEIDVLGGLLDEQEVREIEAATKAVQQSAFNLGDNIADAWAEASAGTLAYIDSVKAAQTSGEAAANQFIESISTLEKLRQNTAKLQEQAGAGPTIQEQVALDLAKERESVVARIIDLQQEGSAESRKQVQTLLQYLATLDAAIQGHGSLNQAIQDAVKNYESAAEAARAQQKALETTRAIQQGVSRAIQEVSDGIFDSISGARSLGEAFRDTARQVLRLVSNLLLVRSITTLIGKAFPSLFSVPGKAAGGPVTAGKAYVVGERGPELFIPRESGQIIPNNKASSGGTSVGGVTVVNNFNIQSTDGPGVRAALEAATPSIVSTSVQLAKRSINQDFRRPSPLRA